MVGGLLCFGCAEQNGGRALDRSEMSPSEASRLEAARVAEGQARDSEPSWLERCPRPIADWVPADTGGPDGESVMACLRRLGSAIDDRIPLDQAYEMTTFGGPGDEQPTQCEAAPDADGTWFYAANRQRFGCGQRARLVDLDRKRCAIVEVADLGPNICVEEASGQPTWDVSPLVTKHLFGASQAGWSEHRKVIGAPVDASNPLGPCEEHLAPPRPDRSFVGGACAAQDDCRHSGATCLGEAAGWPGGHCTASCTDECPTRGGGYALTACARLPSGEGRCMARCDFTLFESGCRPDYACLTAPHPDGVRENRVCAPMPTGCR